MADLNNTQLTQKVLANEQAISDIMANTKQVTAFDNNDRQAFYDAIFPNGTNLSIANPQVKAGELVYGESAGINGGQFFIGIAQQANPTTDAHIEFKYQLFE